MRGGGGEFFPDSIHWFMAAPRNVRRYQNRRWICTAKTAYQKYNCSFKYGKKIRNIVYAPQECGYAVIVMFSMF